ncbi:MAG: glutamate--tRNA ligase [Longimicrobiales bacterium]
MNRSTEIRVRFAPSPTGFLHVGGARTALFNWLFARHHNGIFVLRIEDTDRERSDPAMTDAILESMTWLGLGWDEGPFHQADGLDRHQQDALAMLQNGTAYRCFCTPAELETKRAAAGEGYRYDRTCLSLSAEQSAARARAGESHTIRFRVPDGVTAWDDAVYGRIEFPNTGLDDFIIMRSDGTPIYNMAVVSDDISMRITHVIRGDDHVSNTPKQILIYQALEQPLPVFAHVPMILGSDGKRLAKRHGATAVGEYQQQGILPQALANFLALLGWAPGEDREIMSVAEMVQRFSLEAINRKSAVFDPQKLQWMNGQYINALPASELEPLVRKELAAAGDAVDSEGARLARAIEMMKPRSRTIREMADQIRPYLGESVVYDAGAVEKHWRDGAGVTRGLITLREHFASLRTWDAPSLDAALRDVAQSQAVSAAALIHPLRVALTGRSISPGIFDVLAVLGREVSLSRIDSALQKLQAGAGQNEPA